MFNHLFNGARRRGAAFDVDAVAAVAALPVFDDEGAVHFRWCHGGVRLTPRGSTAECAMVVVDGQGRLQHRDLEVTTGGAVVIARAIDGLHACRKHRHRGGRLGKLAERTLLSILLIDELGDDRAVAAADDLLRGIGLLPAPSVTPPLDPLDRGALAMRSEGAIGTFNDLPGSLAVAYIDGVLVIERGWTAERAVGYFQRIQNAEFASEPVPFEIPAANVLLALDALDGMMHEHRACQPGAVAADPERARRLAAIRDGALAGKPVTPLYRDLIELFDAERWPAGDVDPRPQTLQAVAHFAMEVWSARARLGGRGRPIDLARLDALAGQAAIRGGDERGWRFASGEVSIRPSGGLAVGHARAVDRRRELVSDLVVLDADVLESLVLALRAIDVMPTGTTNALVDHVTRVIRRQERTLDTVGLLQRLATGRNRAQREAAGDLLAQLPD